MLNFGRCEHVARMYKKDCQIGKSFSCTHFTKNEEKKQCG
nr:MAG TPA: hypothetical protein [Caudoviricetes sp.]